MAVDKVLAAVAVVTVIPVDAVKVDLAAARVRDRAKEPGGKVKSPVARSKEHGKTNQG